MDLGQLTASVKFLIRDRAGQFTGSFDAVFTAESIRIVAKVLQHIQRPDVIMCTDRQQDIPRDLGAGALLDDDERLILVEVKARSRPLGARNVFQAEGMLHAYESYFGRRLPR
jgi:hypothetical protein